MTRRLYPWAAVAFSCLLAACGGSGSGATAGSGPCGDLNTRLAGEWVRIEGNTNQLPDEFTLTPSGGTGGIYSQPGLGNLEYLIAEECDAILLVDGNKQLYQTWGVEVDDDRLFVQGPWQRTSDYQRVE